MTLELTGSQLYVATKKQQAVLSKPSVAEQVENHERDIYHILTQRETSQRLLRLIQDVANEAKAKPVKLARLQLRRELYTQYSLQNNQEVRPFIDLPIDEGGVLFVKGSENVLSTVVDGWLSSCPELHKNLTVWQYYFAFEYLFQVWRSIGGPEWITQPAVKSEFDQVINFIAIFTELNWIVGSNEEFHRWLETKNSSRVLTEYLANCFMDLLDQMN